MLKIDGSVPSITTSISNILTSSTTVEEAAGFWKETYRNFQGNVFQPNKCRISNQSAIKALFLNLPFSKIDFSECTFTDEAFQELLEGQPSCQLVIKWPPFEQLFQIERKHLFNCGKFTIYPPKTALTADEVELLIKFVQDLFSEPGNFCLDLSSWAFRRDELAQFPCKGLLLLPVSEERRETSSLDNEKELFTHELYQNGDADESFCIGWWRTYFSKPTASVTLNNSSDSYNYISRPLHISALFKVLEEKGIRLQDLDIQMIIFSEEAWNELVACLKRYRHKVTEFLVSAVTVNQLKTLFESPEILEMWKLFTSSTPLMGVFLLKRKLSWFPTRRTFTEIGKIASPYSSQLAFTK